MEVRTLKDILGDALLDALGDDAGGGTIDGAWQARVVPPPVCANDGDAAMEVLRRMCAGESSRSGVPREPAFHLPTAAASEVFRECREWSNGGDGIAFVTNEQWNAFERPKVCFRSGWAAPGSQMADERFFRTVTSFESVLRGKGKDVDGCMHTDEVINLQMFHREKRPECETDGVAQRDVVHGEKDARGDIPCLPRRLRWPRWMVGDPAEGDNRFVEAKSSPVSSSSTTSPSSSPAPAALYRVLDNATRVSRKGAVTWWYVSSLISRLNAKWPAVNRRKARRISRISVSIPGWGTDRDESMNIHE